MEEKQVSPWLQIIMWSSIIISFLILLTKLPPVKGLIKKLFGEVLAWDNSKGAKAKNKNIEIIKMKKKLFESMEGTISKVGGYVLEIGAGSGPNLQFYPSNTKLITVDLSEHFKEYLEENLKKFDHVTLVKYLIGNCEDLKGLVADESCACVVSSLILCCVEQDLALNEIMRVLKPGGKLYFIEHIVEQRGTFNRWLQKQIEPLWKAVKFNCHLTKNTDILLKTSAFQDLHAEVVYRPTPSIFNCLFTRSFVGHCTKPYKS